MRFAPKEAKDRIALRLGGYGIPLDKAVKSPRSGELGEAYSWEGNGKFYAIGFAGSAFRASFYYSYRNAEGAALKISQFFDGLESWAKMKDERKAKRAAAPRGLEVGDVLRSSWGYDQTNIDYYEVTRLVGTKQVEIRAICADSAEDQGWMRGTSVPMPGRFCGEPMIKNAVNGAVKIASYASAFKMEPTAEVAGKKMYSPSSWTAYA